MLNMVALVVIWGCDMFGVDKELGVLEDLELLS